MSNYTTDAIEFDECDINNIVEQCKKWNELDIPKKLDWLNEVYAKCLNFQEFPLRGEIDIKDIQTSAMAGDGSSDLDLYYRQSDFSKRDFTNILYLFFHELHHIKMHYLQRDVNIYNVFSENEQLKLILISFRQDFNHFSKEINLELKKLIPSEYFADKFAKNCLMFLFNKTGKKEFLEEIIKENNLQTYYLNKIKEHAKSEYLGKEYFELISAELSTEAEQLKKLKEE